MIHRDREYGKACHLHTTRREKAKGLCCYHRRDLSQPVREEEGEEEEGKKNHLLARGGDSESYRMT